jgi:hypothetical protein
MREDSARRTRHLHSERQDSLPIGPIRLAAMTKSVRLHSGRLMRIFD